MARIQSIQISGINFSFDHHPAGIYERLLIELTRSRAIAKIYGDRFGMFSQIYSIPAYHNIRGLVGVISTFTKLDPNLPWFNVATNAEANEVDLGQLRLPDNLEPNYRQCHFVFDSQRHVFYFDSLTRKGGVSPLQMLKFLKELTWSEEVFHQYGRLNLTIVPDERAITDILNWRAMRTLHIHLTRPNVGDFDDEEYQAAEEEIAGEMDEEGVTTQDIRKIATDGRFLEPNAETRKKATVASVNGYVEASGRDGHGNSVSRSTKDQAPHVEKDVYNPEIETFYDAIVRVADVFSARLRRNRRP